MAGSGGAQPFDCAVKIPLRAPDPGTDCKLPAAGALNYGAITSFSALASTNGSTTSLVTGDHFEMMHGNEFRTIFLDREHTILGNQLSTVNQNRHDITQKNYNQHVTAATQRYHNGATNEVFNQPHANTHATKREMHEPTQLFNLVTERVEKLNKATANFGIKTDIILMKTDITAVAALEWASVAVEGKGTEVAYQAFSGHEFGILKTEAHEAELKAKVVNQRLAALENKTAELDTRETAIFFVPIAFGIYI
jgi:hypothetical protein